MREILFKAKREDNGEWVEGSLVHCKASVGKSVLCLIVCSAEWLDNPKWFNLCNVHYVDAETVCQYTGLNDKNGVKIFEGDLIRIETVDFDIEGEVVYENGVFECVNGDIEELLWYHPAEMKVLGNIFDNTELMGV